MEKHHTKGSLRAYQEVIAGMVSSVRGGTCAHAVHPGYSLAGKTGTAQNRGKDHSVFMGFAPVVLQDSYCCFMLRMVDLVVRLRCANWFANDRAVY